jgi:hypothetical protein
MPQFSEIADRLAGLDRSPFVGVRELRHPLQGVRAPGTPRTIQEKIADAAQVQKVHRTRSGRRAAHPVGQGRRLRRAERVRRRPRRTHRHDQLEHVPGRGLQARQPLQPDGVDPQEGRRPPPRLHRDHDGHRLAGPQDLARRRHELPGPGRHPRPPGPSRRGPRRDLRGPRTGPADRARVQVLRAGLLHTDVPDWGTSLRSTAWPSARRPGLPRHRPPRPRHEHRVHRRPAAAPGNRLGSFDFNSRFYADDDLIVGAADPFQLFRILYEVVRGGGYENPTSSVHARPVPQHRANIQGQIRSVLNVQEMTRQGAARRRRGARRGSDGRRRARRQRHLHGRLLHRRPRRPRRLARVPRSPPRPDRHVHRERLPEGHRSRARRWQAVRLELISRISREAPQVILRGFAMLRREPIGLRREPAPSRRGPVTLRREVVPQGFSPHRYRFSPHPHRSSPHPHRSSPHPYRSSPHPHRFSPEHPGEHVRRGV